jgi:hypothetical protein
VVSVLGAGVAEPDRSCSPNVALRRVVIVNVNDVVRIERSHREAREHACRHRDDF